MKINSYNWVKHNWRGVIFIDPYAMEFSWQSLEEISKTKIFDVWYLFPYYATNRNLYKNISEMPQANKDKITSILGTNDWIGELYKPSIQMNLFGEAVLEKQAASEIKQYVIKRFNTIFPTVSSEAVLLRNEHNSPMFLLCFMGSNHNPAAKTTSLRIADAILKNTAMERV